jgi:hypothetical protein
VLTAFEFETRVCATGVASETLGIAPSEESLDKFTRLSRLSSFMECSRGDWTLDISEGYNTRSVDATIRAALSPNALYHLGGSNQS